MDIEKKKQQIKEEYGDTWYARQASIVNNRNVFSEIHEALHNHFSIISDSMSSKSWTGYTKNKIISSGSLNKYNSDVEKDAEKSRIALAGALNASNDWNKWVFDGQDWQIHQLNLSDTDQEHLSYNYDDGSGDPGYVDYSFHLKGRKMSNNKLFNYSIAKKAVLAGLNFVPAILYNLTYSEKFNDNSDNKDIHHSIINYGDFNKIKARFRNYELIALMAKISGAGFMANTKQQLRYYNLDFTARCKAWVENNYQLADKKRINFGGSAEYIPVGQAKVSSTNKKINESERDCSKSLLHIKDEYKTFTVGKNAIVDFLNVGKMKLGSITGIQKLLAIAKYNDKNIKQE
jgi:hypothetical protein